MHYFLRNHRMNVKIHHFSIRLCVLSRTTVQQKCGVAFLHSWLLTLGGLGTTQQHLDQVANRDQVVFNEPLHGTSFTTDRTQSDLLHRIQESSCQGPVRQLRGKDRGLHSACNIRYSDCLTWTRKRQLSVHAISHQHLNRDQILHICRFQILTTGAIQKRHVDECEYVLALR